MRVPIASLGIGKDSIVAQRVLEVLESGRFINGPEVEKFEQAWAKRCGAKHCIAVASGSAALTAALKYGRMKHCDGKNLVAIPMLSFAATAFSVLEAGYFPLYVEVGKDGLMRQDVLMDWCKEHKDELNTFIPVHLYGQVLHIRNGLSWCYVVEDACQAHGALTGVQGDVACFSFYPAKNLGAAGDAGAVVTNDVDIANFVRTWINYGDPPGKKYTHAIVGTNARMDALQAAILNAKLEGQFAADQDARRSQAELYSNWYGIKPITTTKPNAWHQFPILVKKPDKFISKMAEVGIGIGRHYPYVLQDIVPGKILGLDAEARNLAAHVVTLPLGPHLVQDQLEYVADQLFGMCVAEDGMWRFK